jgi:hypothetical protein
MAILQHPRLYYAVISFVLALTISATPSFVPLTLLVANLLLFEQFSLSYQDRLLGGLPAVSFGISLSHFSSSLDALSTPAISIIVLLVGSIVTSSIAFLLVFLDTVISKRLNTPWSQITLFPAMWATVWYAVSYLSPVGRLTTWSPILGLESYNWMARYTGPVGYDWVVAAWAVVCSQTVAMLVSRADTVMHQNSTLVDLGPDEEVKESPTMARGVLILGVILGALTLPSFVFNDLPLPPSATETTALTVGCVLPSSSQSSYHYSLDDLIAESKKLTKAKVLLWPEGAVSFENSEARDIAFERVREEVRGPFVSVAFEEFYQDKTSGRGRRRTGVALVSSDSPVIHMTYYKRHLVPST